MTKRRLPHMQKPCDQCPFTTNCPKGWLRNIKEFVYSPLFVCHKKTTLQCAGHMILRKNKSDYYQIAERLGVNLNLKGHDLVFKTEEDCIKHHIPND